ncbi:DUF6891 domain-containing protein [Hyalangium gracile]|uniref:DUF6891 domain-containing protein n=1 Tax=Hyalangium gracile TaxID=394092 RepID=UPI0038994058
MALPDSVLKEIDTLVAAGFDNHESLYLHLFGTMGDMFELPAGITQLSEIPPGTRRLVREAIAAAFAKRAEEQSPWPSVTDGDRLRAAFAELEQRGIVALEHCGVTQDEGIHQAAEVSLARDELGEATHGYCFFHAQDAWRAVHGDLRLRPIAPSTARGDHRPVAR